MHKYLFIFFVLFSTVSYAANQIPTEAISIPSSVNEEKKIPVFEGEVFSKTYISSLANNDKLIEFIRPNESFENWTKLFGYSSKKLPAINNNPEAMAANMARLIASRQKTPDVGILKVDGSGDMVIYFAITPPNGTVTEFNVFRYTKSVDGNSITSLQLAHRAPHVDTTNSNSIIQKQHEEWKSMIRFIVKYDMQQVRSAVE